MGLRDDGPLEIDDTTVLDERMGLAKRWLEEIEARGFGEADGFLCLEHVEDGTLRDKLIPSATNEECTFCGRTSDDGDAFSAPLEELAAEVVTAIRYFYTDASVLPWDGEVGEYVGPVLDVRDVVDDICSGEFSTDVYDDVVDRLVEAIGSDKEWTDWGAVGDSEHLEWGWNEYANIVRTTSRFVFQPVAKVESWPTSPPEQVAAFLESLLVYVDGPLGLVTTVSAGTGFFRGRLIEHPGEFHACAKDLGPAPSPAAGPNRMSPPGVSLLYASEDAETAIAEIAGHGVKPMAMVGEFHNTRDLVLLDLTRTPVRASIFTDKGRQDATMSRFLRTFVSQVTAPVIPDGRQHIEYVPTQVLTEYFRWVPSTKIDGIALPSAQTGRKTFVLFFGPGSVADWSESAPENVSTPRPWDFEEEDASAAFTLALEDIGIYEVERIYKANRKEDRFGMWLRRQ